MLMIYDIYCTICSNPKRLVVWTSNSCSAKRRVPSSGPRSNNSLWIWETRFMSRDGSQILSTHINSHFTNSKKQGQKTKDKGFTFEALPKCDFPSHCFAMIASLKLGISVRNGHCQACIHCRCKDSTQSAHQSRRVLISSKSNFIDHPRIGIRILKKRLPDELMDIFKQHLRHPISLDSTNISKKSKKSSHQDTVELNSLLVRSWPSWW